MTEPDLQPQVVRGGVFPYQTRRGNIIMLESSLAGRIVKEFTPELLQKEKEVFLSSLDKFVEDGRIPEEERKQVIFDFILKNRDMLSVFEIK